MAEGQGNITYGSTGGSGGGGGQTPLVSDGTGLPVFVAPNKIESLKEISGVELTAAAGSIDFTNRLLYFFVKQYGAKGDGVTDDTAAIQACIAAADASAAVAGAAVVYFSAGTYILSGTLVSSEQLTFLGAGKVNNTQLVWNADIPGVQLSANFCQLRYMEFTNNFAGASVGTIGVAYSGLNLVVDTCYFVGWYDQLVQTEQVASSIFNSNFAAFQHYGIYSTNTNPDEGDGSVINCFFEINPGGPSPVAGFWSDNSGGWKILNCKVLGNALLMYGFVFNVTSSGTSDFLMVNNSIETCAVAGVYVIETGSLMRFVTILGGNISSYEGGDGIILTKAGGTFNGVSIVGVSISFNNNGIVINDVLGVVISGNNFFDNSTDVLRTGTTQVDFGLAGDDDGTPPATTVAAPAAVVYGSNAATLTTPDAWTEVVINNITYKMPLYL